MTKERKKEISDKARELAANNTQLLGFPLIMESIVRTAIETAQWCDEHPRQGLVDVEKVCKYLSEHFYVGVANQLISKNEHPTQAEFLEDFRRAMNENK